MQIWHNVIDKPLSTYLQMIAICSEEHQLLVFVHNLQTKTILFKNHT